jgi:hypothetical protein
MAPFAPPPFTIRWDPIPSAAPAAYPQTLPPHLPRDWAHPCHICPGTGLTPPTSAPGLGPTGALRACVHARPRGVDRRARPEPRALARLVRLAATPAETGAIARAAQGDAAAVGPPDATAAVHAGRRGAHCHSRSRACTPAAQPDVRACHGDAHASTGRSGAGGRRSASARSAVADGDPERRGSADVSTASGARAAWDGLRAGAASESGCHGRAGSDGARRARHASKGLRRPERIVRCMGKVGAAVRCECAVHARMVRCNLRTVRR